MGLDKLIFEDGNGGAVNIASNDYTMTRSIYTMIYVALFGGNVAQSSSNETEAGELINDWWGNNKNADPSSWINSETERSLRGVDTTQKTAIRIKKAVLKDIEKYKYLGEQEVLISFPTLNHVKITVIIKEPEKTSNISITWDATKKEAIINELI